MFKLSSIGVRNAECINEVTLMLKSLNVGEFKWQNRSAVGTKNRYDALDPIHEQLRTATVSTA